MKVKTRAISEGAMMLAMMGMLLVVNRQLATVLELMFFLISVPVIVYSVKYGMKMGLVLSVSALVIALLTSPLTTLFYVASALVIGLFYSYGVLHKYKSSYLLIFTTLANLLVTLFTVVLLGAIFGYNIQEEIQFLIQLLPSKVTLSTILYDYIVFVVMAGYIALAFMQALIIHLVTLAILKVAHGNLIEEQVSINGIVLPKWVALLGCLSFVAYLISSDLKVVHTFTMYLFALFFFLFIVDGCISLIYYFKNKKLNHVRVMLIILAGLLPLLQILIAFIGMYDIACAWRMKMKAGVPYEIHRTN